jgi:hypothetical protein
VPDRQLPVAFAGQRQYHQIGASHLQRLPGDELQYFVNFRAVGSGRVASTLTCSTAAAGGPPRTPVRGCVPDADDIRCAR